MFLITGIIIAALFLVSTSMPLLSWILPFYKIKKLENADIKTKIVANLVAVLCIGWVDISFLVPYFGIYILIEVMYLLFNRYGKKVDMFDRIFITTLTVGSLVFGYLYFHQVGLNLSLEHLKNMYMQKTDFTQSEINTAFHYIKENTMFLIYFYIAFTVFFTYYLLGKDTFTKWKVSYVWLIPYIILFFIEKYAGLDSALVVNGLNVFKIIYALYFIKVVTGLLNVKVKNPSICFIVGLIMTFMSPEFAFIFGALASGINIKVKVIK